MIFSAPQERIFSARAAVRMPPPTRTFILARLAEELDPARVGAFAHGGVEINHMQDGIVAEAVEQAEDVVHGERALAAANELHGAAILQIDARNDHRVIDPEEDPRGGFASWRMGRRTGTPRSARNFFSAGMECVALWKIEAARAASARPCGEDGEKIVEGIRAARSDDRHGDGGGDFGGEFAIEAAASAVAVNGGEQNFARAARYGFGGPVGGVEARGVAAAARVGFPGRARCA